LTWKKEFLFCKQTPTAPETEEAQGVCMYVYMCINCVLGLIGNKRKMRKNAPAI